jgi:EmrB/QacA subfamily drug resistance transporter
MPQATKPGPKAVVPALRRPGVALAVLVATQFMVILDVTVMNVAIPEIGRTLSMDASQLPWVITAYTMSFGGLLILGGRLADRMGHKRVLLAGIVLFTAASAVGATANHPALLLTARSIQGVGAAMMSPAALALVNTEFRGALRTRALTIWGAVAGAGAAIGVVLGGALTSGPGWRWAFLINLPVGVLAIIAIARLVPTRPGDRSRALGVTNAILGTSAVAAAIYAASEVGVDGLSTTATTIASALAATLAVAFVVVEAKSSEPLIARRLLTNRSAVAGLVTMFGATAVLLPLYFLGSINLQDVRGYSALQTGLAFVPAALATIFGAHIAGHLAPRIGYRLLGAIGAITAVAGCVLMPWGGTDGGIPLGFTAPFTLASIGVGILFVTATYSTMGAAAEYDAGLTSATMSSSHELGASLAIALVAAVAAPGFTTSPSDLAANVVDAYWVTAVVAAVVAVAATLLLTAHRPDPAAHVGTFH